MSPPRGKFYRQKGGKSQSDGHEPSPLLGNKNMNQEMRLGWKSLREGEGGLAKRVQRNIFPRIIE